MNIAQLIMDLLIGSARLNDIDVQLCRATVLAHVAAYRRYAYWKRTPPV